MHKKKKKPEQTKVVILVLFSTIGMMSLFFLHEYAVLLDQDSAVFL
jgi:hypothetical protein